MLPFASHSGQMLIASLSGIRGVLNSDFDLSDVYRFSGNFARAAAGTQLLVGRDTRSTGPAMAKIVGAAALSEGKRVVDYGVISTPALFRESRLKGAPAVMVTASHNEPQFNGLKFIEGGRGVGSDTFEKIVSVEKRKPGGFGSRPRLGGVPSYAADLIGMFGAGAFDGVKVAADFGGGAALAQSASILRMLGCDVVSVNDTPGMFNRRVDPVADGLEVLREVVVKDRCDIGLGFDCDGDRLVIVDHQGRKRTGDYMLTLALMEMLRESSEKRVVVSVDTTQAVDDVAKKFGAEVVRAKVGEANVVGAMMRTGARLGGEGSSGGLIDGSFNYCRDSMLAALVIIRALKRSGTKFYGTAPSYHQERGTVQFKRAAVQKALRRLALENKKVDATDGVKVQLSGRSWVLVRPSGTEDLVRVSAEAETSEKAARIVKEFSAKLKGLGR